MCMRLDFRVVSYNIKRARLIVNRERVCGFKYILVAKFDALLRNANIASQERKLFSGFNKVQKHFS